MNLNIRSIALASVISAILPVHAATTNSAQLAASTLSPDCLGYRVVGLCAWVLCAPKCKVRTSVKVKHYVPELVVSSYHPTGENPWREVARLSPKTSQARGGGNMTARHANTRDILSFRNVDAIGHPGNLAFSQFAGASGYVCPSGTYPLAPHFLSTLDIVGWRYGPIEMVYPESLIPGLRELGRPGDNWGNIFPRTGFVVQADSYRASAVTAQRVADLVTRTSSPHVYIPLSPRRRDGYWPPGPVVEGDESTHKWQAVAPKLENTCSVWPDRGPLSSHADRIDESDSQVWTLWRPYSCCEKRGHTLIHHTGN